MQLAVHVYNNPSTNFRAECFAVLAIIAWTYISIEYCARNNLPIERQDGNAISLADFLKFKECPLVEGVRNNLKSIINLRNSVEHRTLGKYDREWLSLFQACCINYENFIVSQFGERLSLRRDLAFALQFSGLSLHQAQGMIEAELPQEIEAINSEVYQGLSETQMSDPDFQFSVVYTTVASSKSKANFRFISSDEAEAETVANILVKNKPSTQTHPYRANQVVELVKERTGKKFSSHDHTQAWKRLKVRPSGDAEDPSVTKQDYCFYNATFKSYSYSEAWVQKLCDFVELQD
nr:DUF3644 domain-containing protein [Thalassovita mangrovi]